MANWAFQAAERQTVLGVSPSLAVPTSGYAKHARLCSHLPLWAWGDRWHPNQGREEQASNDNSQNSKMRGS